MYLAPLVFPLRHMNVKCWKGKVASHSLFVFCLDARLDMEVDYHTIVVSYQCINILVTHQSHT
jgi:hypothetical protein